MRPVARARRHDSAAARLAWCVAALALWASAVWASLAGENPRDAELAAEAKSLAEAALGHYGQGYTTRIDNQRHIVYVSAVDQKTLDHVVALLGSYADQERRALFPEPLLWNMTVVLPTLADYRKSVTQTKVSGYYRQATRTLESISLSDALIHEFTHGLHHSDQASAGQRHPTWVSEGLACLFQRSAIRGGRLEFLPGRDMVVAQQAAGNRKAHSFRQLFAMDHEAFMVDAELCYAEAHYVWFYLYRQGKLREFYDDYKAGYAADPTGVATLAKTLGRSLEEVESDWREWLLRQEPPWTPAHPAKPVLGVRMEAAEAGVLVTGFVPGSVAARAGQIKVGDVVISVAGQSTPTPKDLAAAVQVCQPGETVDVEVIRGDQVMSVKQLLSLMPP
jgi:hypothetical protein